MQPVIVHRDIDASPERVFEIVSEIDRWPERISAIEKIDFVEGSGMQAGTVFLETRQLFGRSATETMTIAEVDAPTSFLLTAASNGSDYRSEFRVEPREGGARLSLSFQGVPRTFFAKVMAFLMKPMMKKMVEMCAKDLDDLKTAAEASS